MSGKLLRYPIQITDPGRQDRELGVGDGKQFWRKLKWVSKKGEIADLKSRIMVHTCNISLCMSSIGK